MRKALAPDGGVANRIGPDGQARPDQVAMEWKVLLFLHASMRTGSGELRITFGHGDSQVVVAVDDPPIGPSHGLL